jgi:PqqD family protein of HPr-rel-A system
MAVLADPGVRWRGTPVPALAWRDWDGGFVVYNPSTGSTHLLAPVAGSVLRLLSVAEAGATLAELADGLEVDAHTEDRQDCLALIAKVLDEFNRLGLAHAESA